MAELMIRPGTRMKAAREVPVGQDPDFNMICTYVRQEDDAAFVISVPMGDGQKAEFDPMQKYLFRYGSGSEEMIVAGYADDALTEGFRSCWKMRRVSNQRQYAQRQDVRYRISLRMSYIAETWPVNMEGTIEPSEGFTLDISAGGMAMLLGSRFEVGEVIECSLPRVGTDPDGAAIENISGAVCWEREAPKGSIYRFMCGVQYRFADPSEKERMARYVDNARRVYKL